MLLHTRGPDAASSLSCTPLSELDIDLNNRGEFGLSLPLSSPYCVGTVGNRRFQRGGDIGQSELFSVSEELLCGLLCGVPGPPSMSGELNPLFWQSAGLLWRWPCSAFDSK